MEKASSFSSDAKRFLFPLKDFPLETVKNACDALWIASFSYVNLFLATRITKSIETGDSRGFELWMYGFIWYVVLYWSLRTLMRRWGFVEFRHRIMKRLFGDYGKEFFMLDNGAFERFGTWKIAWIYDKGVSQWVRLLHVFVRNTASLTVTAAVAMAVIASSRPSMLLAFLSLIALSIVGNRYVTKVTREAKKERTRVSQESDRHMVRMAMSKFETLQNDRIGAEVAKVESYWTLLEPVSEVVERWSRISFAIPGWAVDMLRIALYFGVGYGVFEQTHSISDLVWVIALIGLIDQNLQRLIDMLDQFQQEFIAVRNLWDTFDDTPRMQGYEEGSAFLPGYWRIEIRDLAYRYDDLGPVVLNWLNLDIEWGKKIALVGPSGWGKTTLMKIMSGYFLATSWKILVDGQDLSKVARKTYYAKIGYLTQDPSVFDGTIRENLISAAGRECGDEEIRHALESTNCDFVWSLPERLESEIGERWVRLSGGQRQRLAIAKIFLKNPEIVFLDEPTSALDSFSEESITKALDSLFKGRTVVIIAHRLQTVREADEILVLENGKIVERWGHAALLASNGTYARMVELQSGF